MVGWSISRWRSPLVHHTDSHVLPRIRGGQHGGGLGVGGAGAPHAGYALVGAGVLNAIFGAKAAAALVLAAMQCVAWIGLLRLNRIQLANAGLVLLLSLLVAGILSVVAAFIASYFKDRERSQFMYSLSMMIAAGVSYFLDSSPITLMTRLATRDFYIGILNLVGYVAVMIALLVLFLLETQRLVGLKS